MGEVALRVVDERCPYSALCCTEIGLCDDLSCLALC
jgi:hypothetical protein